MNIAAWLKANIYCPIKVCRKQNYLIWVRVTNHERNAAISTQFLRYMDTQWQNKLPSLVTCIIQSWLGGKYSPWYCNITGGLLLFKLNSIKQQPLDVITPDNLAECCMHMHKTKQKSCTKTVPWRMNWMRHYFLQQSWNLLTGHWMTHLSVRNSNNSYQRDAHMW